MSNRESPIEPSVGRVVLFRSPSSSDMGVTGAQEVPALVVFVHNTNCVNLRVQADGPPKDSDWRTSVPYCSGEPGDGVYGWRWMPYQLQQAKPAVDAPQGSAA